MSKLNAKKSLRLYKKDLEEKIYKDAEARLRQLFEAYAGKAAGNYHLSGQLLPLAAVCMALEENGFSREEALARTAALKHKELSYPSAAKIKRALRLPGLYRLFPRVYEKLIRSSLFGPQNGFAVQHHAHQKGCCRFEITRCPYYDVSRELGYAELTEAFCQADEICYGSMHPRLAFERSGTLADGAEQCDFCFLIKDAASEAKHQKGSPNE